MPGKAVGQAAAELPWLCPNTDSLISLAEAPAALALSCSDDPALLAFLLRFTPSAPPGPQPISGLFCPAALAGATLPDAAAYLLANRPGGWVPPSCEVFKRCYALTERAAAFARALAEHSRRACPERAAAVVRLAPLGWLAVAAIDPGAAAEPLHDPGTPPLPGVQAALWGFDQNAIARRLASRWRLPEWAASALGNLGLPLGAARAVVADLGVFAVAQLALVEAEKRLPALGLTHGTARGDVLKELSLPAQSVEELWAATPAPLAKGQSTSALDANPHKVPLVANLLRLTGDSRRRNGAALVARLEDRLDELHRAVGVVSAEADARVRDAKLAALAELAAGAGHEINNPLAIISGNAQRLFRTEPEPDRGDALQSIIRQTERIAGIIRDLMQFARPTRPNPHRHAVAELLGAVQAEMAAFAEEKGIRLELGRVGGFARCDFTQIKHALAALARNGIEAAGRDGWVRLSSTEGDDEFVTLVVEDSGPGLSPAAREHAFDPFYCGRSAGRGRGLGLPTAWQFVRQNGGELRHETEQSGTTRFVLTVPRSVTLEFLDRQSA
jgi:signal transduction histidine kinase